MQTVKVTTLSDISVLRSLNGRYELKTCKTYLYVQDVIENKVLTEISLSIDVDVLNNMVSVFGFPKIVLDKDDTDKDFQIKTLQDKLRLKDEIIERQRKYIEQLQGSIITTNAYRKQNMISAYKALIN